MISFVEREDRFESSVVIDSGEVVVSADKPISPAKLSGFGELVEATASKLLYDSKTYFNACKAENNLEFIDDMAEPQILAGPDFVSVFWCSEKGEAQGASIIGVDFTIDGLVPIGLVIGD